MNDLIDRFEYVDNTYYGHFSPPTNASRHVYIRVFITDTSISADSIPIVGSYASPGQYVKVGWCRVTV